MNVMWVCLPHPNDSTTIQNLVMIDGLFWNWLRVSLFESIKSSLLHVGKRLLFARLVRRWGEVRWDEVRCFLSTQFNLSNIGRSFTVLSNIMYFISSCTITFFHLYSPLFITIWISWPPCNQISVHSRLLLCSPFLILEN